MYAGTPRLILLITLLAPTPLYSILINSDSDGQFSTCRYELLSDHVTRDVARAACAQRHGKLAVIISEDENEEVIALLAAAKGGEGGGEERRLTGAWIGLVGQGKVHRWENGRRLRGYSR